MSAPLESIFNSVAVPLPEGVDNPVYAVLQISGYENYFIGKDRDGHACLLIATSKIGRQLGSPIRLENLDVQFDLRCHLKHGKDAESAGIFTVVRCRSVDKEIVRYFLSVCDTIIGILGDWPKQREIAAAVHRLAAIFQKLQKTPTRSINGLFGELYLISRSESPTRAMMAWRVDESARFDFADGDLRMDVKTTSGRLRAHTFSYDQCSPPPGIFAVVASLFVEHSPGGFTLRSLIGAIESSIAAHPDLIFKLHEVVAATLGAEFGEAMGIAFDIKLTDSSLHFYNLHEIPAIREPLPNGVSDVHFRSDLSALTALSPEELIEKNPAFGGLLPKGC